MSDVPALRRGLAVLRVLATRPGPISAAAIARELELPRSTTYHLLAELEAAGFVVHLEAERRYGLGIAAFELGSAYLRHDPLERLAAPLLRKLADRVGHTAQLGVLHGNELMYLLKERPPAPETLVTDVGVRLPAHLPASGQALLAHLPHPHVRALFPRSFVTRTGRGPSNLASLRRALAEVRTRGWAVEDGHVTPDFASVALAVFDHNGSPLASVSVTFRHVCPSGCGETWPGLARDVRTTAASLTRQIGGRAPGRA
ncbi:IclR family transcriptional regulator [Amycolatopsis thermophila]|uniref:DNA-binding IclR family transcriptional regulator n=1 Tax=Amycolatopsis thermophila TaxID=206084 RepID=A0ABU0EP75_9PSEU|nr:IclR family transcriptional regulator [Amycolatopsis thermophila]MDQ0377100.1 DNA-binding IclR family transcriptional regulator [Amycolatopsis thermophila]